MANKISEKQKLLLKKLTVEKSIKLKYLDRRTWQGLMDRAFIDYNDRFDGVIITELGKKQLVTNNH